MTFGKDAKQRAADTPDCALAAHDPWAVARNPGKLAECQVGRMYTARSSSRVTGLALTSPPRPHVSLLRRALRSTGTSTRWEDPLLSVAATPCPPPRSRRSVLWGSG